MEFREIALVCKVGKFKEADLWVRLFTPGRGIFTAFAFGGSKSRRRFSGCLDHLNVIEVAAKASKCGQYNQLQETSLVKSYSGLRSSVPRLGLAVNCIKFAEAVQAGAEVSSKTFELLVEALDVLDQSPSIPPTFPVFFRSRITREIGFGPTLDTCVVCGKAAKEIVHPRFSIERGSLHCRECGPVGGLSLHTTERAISTMNEVFVSSPSRWNELAQEPDVRSNCFNLMDRFVEYHLGLAWDRWRYVRR